MNKHIEIRPMTRSLFQPFGDLIALDGEPDKIINQGFCGRYHDRAQLDFQGGEPCINLFKALPRQLPYELDMLERHPLGSQCFVPMSWHAFLVIVAPDQDGTPQTPIALMTEPGQAINFHKGTWHGVLTPLSEPGLFAVLDRKGEGNNLEEFWFEENIIITETKKQ